jgi:hypothetical protein
MMDWVETGASDVVGKFPAVLLARVSSSLLPRHLRGEIGRHNGCILSVAHVSNHCVSMRQIPNHNSVS